MFNPAPAMSSGANMSYVPGSASANLQSWI
jgi:hypothetical protein